jgi:bifunctional UDP-N-acetylglucosamine pyrophosphorylase/glucosamine-1-phosphate N-acetyltransferase
VLYGDVPLIRVETLARLLEVSRGGEAVALLTVDLAEPAGYGRILRDADGRVTGIVEQKDATAQQLCLNEVNTGILAAPGSRLKQWLTRLDNANAQGEYYLTDVIAMAVADGVEVVTTQPDGPDEVMGVNDRLQLAHLERCYQRREARRLMLGGVTLADPGRLDVRGEVTAGRDVSIDVNVILEGRVELGERVSVGANTVLRNVRIDADALIHPNCVIEDAVIGGGCRIGPFARIRPETQLAAQVHVGNFVEIKKSRVAYGSKINHLSYVGDAEIGSRVNIGAGTITCNYDGAHKHKTVIGDDVFVGSDSQLVAPVNIGNGATVGAGSTITRDVPPGELALSRVRQETRRGWKRPVKKQ